MKQIILSLYRNLGWVMTFMLTVVMCFAFVNCKKTQIINQSGYGLSVSMSNALRDGYSAVEMGDTFGMILNDVIPSIPRTDNPEAIKLRKTFFFGADFYSLTTWTNLQSQLRAASVK